MGQYRCGAVQSAVWPPVGAGLSYVRFHDETGFAALAALTVEY
jgi:hypothetical protein